jgi:hypothetical protein
MLFAAVHESVLGHLGHRFDKRLRRLLPFVTHRSVRGCYSLGIA